MKKVWKLFFDIKTEKNWLSNQVGWKLVHKSGLVYTFEESSLNYHYKYVFFEKNKNELNEIRNQITDKHIEFICTTWCFALFRKDASKGEIQVFQDNYTKYNTLMKKWFICHIGSGVLTMCAGGLQTAVLIHTLNSLSGISAALFYFSSSMFFMAAYLLKKYALGLDE